MCEIKLMGCSTEPLSNYLKALGIFRLVAEQKDESAKGKWINGYFVLKSKLNKDELINFFSDEYKPTPIISPWNKNGGFLLPKKRAKKSLDKIINSDSERFKNFKEDIEEAKKITEQLLKKEKINEGQSDKNDKTKKEGSLSKSNKQLLIQNLRNKLSDNAIKWIDAIYVLNNDKSIINPLLGIGGGNDGQAEFSLLFIDYLTEELINKKQTHNLKDRLENSIFGLNKKVLKKGAFGQFNPYAVGNFNASSNGKSESFLNPWDFIFTLEGSLLFSGSANKKYNPDISSNNNKVSSAFPFIVSTVNGSDYSISDNESNSNEIWLPIWDDFASFKEIETLFSEAKSDFENKSVKNAVEFLDAIQNYRVDRGFSSFNRYIFTKRNGLSYFIVKIGEFKVKNYENAYLIKGFVNLYEKFNNKKVPKKGLAKIIFNMYKYGIGKHENTQNAILELTKLANHIVRTEEIKKENLIPKPELDKGIVEYTDDNSIEFRLAYSLANSLKYNYIDLIKEDKQKFQLLNKWLSYEKKDYSWFNLIMNDYILFLSTHSDMEYPTYKEICINNYKSNISDINAFINKKVNYKKIIDLTLGFLIFLKKFEYNYPNTNNNQDTPELYYFIEKLCFSEITNQVLNKKVRLVPGIYKKIVIGDWRYAFNLSLWRLKSDNVSVPNLKFNITPDDAKIISAALIFPLNYSPILNRYFNNLIIDLA